MKAAELMHVHVPTVTPDSDLRDAVDKLDLYQVEGLPVVDEERTVIGLVTWQGISAPLGWGSDDSAEALRRARGLSGLKVADVMTSPPVTVEEDMDALAAAELLSRSGLEFVPVVSGGHMAGTLSRLTLTQAAMAGTLDPGE
jgi:CBS domain-containing protein